MTELLLIRHAEAEGNLYRRCQGCYDAGLTELGKRQAACLAAHLASRPLQAVYASDLRRAEETAACTAQAQGLSLTLRRDLREVDMGEWEDRCWGALARFEPEQYRLSNSDPARWQTPGAEPYLLTQRRMRAALLDIAARHPGQRVAVFSHGAAIRDLLALLLAVPSAEIDRVQHGDNTCIAYILAENGNLRLERYNDNAHLPPALSAFSRDSWWKNPDYQDGRDLYFLPMDLEQPAQAAAYLRRYREAWIASYGSDEGFSQIHLQRARLREPGSVLEVYAGARPCGILELSPEQNADQGWGHIALLELDEAWRGQGLAVQLLGQAVSHYRALGRRALSLRVVIHNERALRFYERWGFRRERLEQGIYGDSYLMLKDIS